jgi:hypothetical protein
VRRVREGWGGGRGICGGGRLSLRHEVWVEVWLGGEVGEGLRSLGGLG